MIDLERMPGGYRLVCDRCGEVLLAPTLRDLAQGRAEHVAGCCISWPEVQPLLLKVLCENPEDEAAAKRICMNFVCKIGEDAGNRLYTSARADLEARRESLERELLLKSFAGNPAGAQAVLLAQLASGMAKMEARFQQASAPNIIVNVPQQPPPVIENRIELPQAEPPVVNVENRIELPPRKDRNIKFETDKDGRITGAKVKSA
jgi:hypothetical protein